MRNNECATRWQKWTRLACWQTLVERALAVLQGLRVLWRRFPVCGVLAVLAVPNVLAQTSVRTLNFAEPDAVIRLDTARLSLGDNRQGEALDVSLPDVWGAQRRRK